MSARPTVIALLAALAATGCRALGVSPGRPDAIPAMPSMGVAQMVEQHNRNAQLVQSLEATPSVSDRAIGAASGQMALVRPRDFRLTLRTAHRGKVAEVGSNSEEFWIWSAGSKPKQYYVGHYTEAGFLASDLVLQPEWITEALGLYVIPEDEARRITPHRGDAGSTIVLVHHRVGPRGEPTIKKTFVDRESGRIVQHQFFAPDGKTLIARALPSNYKQVAVGGVDGSPGEAVWVPTHLKLYTTPPGGEARDFTMALGSVKINQFDEANRAMLFAVPAYEEEGYARVNLDERSENARAAASQVRETMPAPPTGARVKLSDPVSVGVEGEARLIADPAPLSPDLPAPGAIDAVVGARIPRPPGTAEPFPLAEAPEAGHPGGRLH
jgi:hypothetical protein